MVQDEAEETPLAGTAVKGPGTVYSPLCPQAGGPEGSRTPDLLNANQALSQLSYGPACERAGRYGVW